MQRQMVKYNYNKEVICKHCNNITIKNDGICIKCELQIYNLNELNCDFYDDIVYLIEKLTIKNPNIFKKPKWLTDEIHNQHINR